jgi:hypothetical protein
MYGRKTLTRNKTGSGLYYFGQEGGARGSLIRRLPLVRSLTRLVPDAAKYIKRITGGCGGMVVEIDGGQSMPVIPMMPAKKRATKPKGKGITPYGGGIIPYGAGVQGFGTTPFGGKKGGNYSNSPASPTELNRSQLAQLRDLRAKDPYGEVPVFDRHAINLLSNVIQSKQIVESEAKKKGAGMRYYGSN